MTWNIDDPQGDESAKIKYEIVKYTRGKGLDLGCGMNRCFPHFIGVDNGHHFGEQTVAQIFSDCSDLKIFGSQSMDFVFSSHLLEHIENYKAALKEWWRVIKPGGHLVVYLPHKDFYPNIGEEGSNTDHKHDFLPTDIIEAMKKFKGWDLVKNEERNEDFEYSFVQVFKKCGDSHKYSYSDIPHPKKVAVVRYGGFGDMIQASSVLPWLKDEGYHITFYTTPTGHNILKTDPHIDEFFIQDKDQVPNKELIPFWEVQREHYDRWINLSESVEGSLLALPGRPKHLWPKKLKRKMLDHNYLDFTHWVADVPLPNRQKFYPTNEEHKWAESKIKDYGPGKNILWVLAGSAFHKTWPHLDEMIARILTNDQDTKVILCGDSSCKVLEQGWEEEPRVICKSGEWSIRETLTIGAYMDLVIGPETGVLNTLGKLMVPKILFLSHSSADQISRYWVNTYNMEPKTDCYPCHLLHYGQDHCIEALLEDGTPSGVAQCQYDISCDEVEKAVFEVLNTKKLLAA